jgi:hydrogenase expression/formation protein HypE
LIQSINEASSVTELPAFSGSCPVALTDHQKILLAHGGGGRLMHDLLEKIFLPAFANPALETRHDSAVLNVGGMRLGFTTDAYVVHPLFFPGGDIGTLAVNGTVNDLAMSGARPLWLSAGFILEEGLPVGTLERLVASMRRAAQEANVHLVAGDTKVVDQGKGDGIFICTAGVGVLEHQLSIAPQSVRPGDAILLSGDVGRHGMAILSVREGLAFESPIESDCAPLAAAVLALLEGGIEVHCLRDLTRGGLATALIEIAQGAGVPFRIDEVSVPVNEAVQGACELLGFDPLYVANEGRFVAFVPAAQADRALTLLRGDPQGTGACVIGEVTTETSALVTLRSRIGASRLLDMLSGEQLPRIC